MNNGKDVFVFYLKDGIWYFKAFSAIDQRPPFSFVQMATQKEAQDLIDAKNQRTKDDKSK